MLKINLRDLPHLFEAQLATLPGAISVALDAGGAAAVEIAKDKIGTYQGAVPPAFPEWAPLAASTVAQKERLGYAPPDNPLLRTGEMRESISCEVDGMTLRVGSTDKVALWQELGTAHIPPRPFIAPALVEATPAIKKELGEAMRDTLADTRPMPVAPRMAAE